MSAHRAFRCPVGQPLVARRAANDVLVDHVLLLEQAHRVLQSLTSDRVSRVSLSPACPRAAPRRAAVERSGAPHVASNSDAVCRDPQALMRSPTPWLRPLHHAQSCEPMARRAMGVNPQPRRTTAPSFRARRWRASIRCRIAAELHDEVGQHLTALLVMLDRLAIQAPAGRAHELEARSCSSSPPATPPARSRNGSSSARRPSTATAPTSSKNCTSRTAWTRPIRHPRRPRRCLTRDRRPEPPRGFVCRGGHMTPDLMPSP